MAFENESPLAGFWRKAGLGSILLSTAIPRETESSISGRVPHQVGGQEQVSRLNPKNMSWPKAALKPSSPIVENQTSESGTKAWTPLQPDELSVQWKSRLEKTRPGHAIWTYADLVLDLEAEPKDEIMRQARLLRRNFLQNLIKALHQPAGTHTFWPTRVLINGIPKPDAPSFWSGVEHLGSRIIFIFGKQAFDDCEFPHDLSQFYRKCYICRLDELGKLASMPRGQQTALAIMQTAFSIAGPRNRR